MPDVVVLLLVIAFAGLGLGIVFGAALLLLASICSPRRGHDVLRTPALTPIRDEPTNGHPMRLYGGAGDDDDAA